MAESGHLASADKTNALAQPCRLLLGSKLLLRRSLHLLLLLLLHEPEVLLLQVQQLVIWFGLEDLLGMPRDRHVSSCAVCSIDSA